MCKVSNVLRREATQVLTGGQVALCRPVGRHVMKRIGVHMHIMAHLIETDLHAVVGIGAVDSFAVQDQIVAIDPQGTDLLTEHTALHLR